jgi:hypothetical protein
MRYLKSFVWGNDLFYFIYLSESNGLADKYIDYAVKVIYTLRKIIFFNNLFGRYYGYCCEQRRRFIIFLLLMMI